MLEESLALLHVNNLDQGRMSNSYKEIQEKERIDRDLEKSEKLLLLSRKVESCWEMWSLHG